jgi:flagellar hook protein FlgE
MGLFGALFAGVSGLSSQSNKIGIISNNISNVNTVGFKQGQASFNTLVVPSGTSTFSPGGVIGANQQLVNQQGLIQGTTSATDVAITGNGFFVVNSQSDGSGKLLYTRAGSFTQDALGNFVNANGYFLQGLPILPDGTTAQPNTNNLQTVAVSSSATGKPTPTSAITLAANFNASQSVLLGNGVTATMTSLKGTSGANVGVSGSQIIVGNDFGAAASNNLTRGNSFTILSGNLAGGSGTQSDVFTYGGYTIGRDVTSTVNGTATGDGDGANILDTETIAIGGIANTNGQASIKVTVANPTDYTLGGHISIAGITAAIGTIPPSEINGEHIITNITGGVITFATTTTGTGGASTTTASAANRTYPFTGNILNATSAAGDFFGSGAAALSTSTFADDALGFNITVNGGTPSNFTYSATPDTTKGQFNSLNSLATAISSTQGLTAKVVGGRLYVSATDANLSVTFANSDSAGTNVGGVNKPGIDWLQEFDLLPTLPGGTTGVFNTLSGLAEQINKIDSTNLVATVNNPAGVSTLSINEANPEQTINFTDNQAGSILKELGIPNLSPVGGVNTTNTLGIIYSPTSTTKDMSSGAVTPQFTKDITVFDAQGNPHTVAFNIVKIGINTWGMELTAVPATDVLPLGGDGQIAYGTVTFNGDGTLKTVTGPMANTIPIAWSNQANTSNITLNLGTPNASDGLTQDSTGAGTSAASVSVANQNGAPVGQLTGVTIDASGFVIASFSNGQTQKLYQVPLANVNNPNGLEAVSGDAYQQTLASGQPTLDTPGQGGTGVIAPSALEQSNVDLSTQLTNLIVAQQAYGANSKVLTVADQLLQQLDQIIQ